jgi:hypothetical protein
MIDSGGLIFDSVLVKPTTFVVGEYGEFDRDFAGITDAELELSLDGDLLVPTAIACGLFARELVRPPTVTVFGGSGVLDLVDLVNGVAIHEQLIWVKEASRDGLHLSAHLR